MQGQLLLLIVAIIDVLINLPVAENVAKKEE